MRGASAMSTCTVEKAVAPRSPSTRVTTHGDSGASAMSFNWTV
ncbi:hypothetical protein [Mycobacterium sp. D16R24]|nr:hypothetical protein [Mycobacterium sp. D16R24]